MKKASWLVASVPLPLAFFIATAGFNGQYLLCFQTASVLAQTPVITPAADGTGTVVTPEGQRLDITGGQTSGDGANLFHSFQQFGLNEGQIANFISSPAIRNILGRIVGGEASLINGLIQVTGGSSNLYLINPAGLIFGPNASLNVPAAFTATTATGIRFDTQWLSVLGNNHYSTLVGTPSAFAFTGPQLGSIANLGHLAVAAGQDLTLLGGTVFNSGKLTAPGGQLTLTAVPSQSVVRISQPGHLLNLEIQPLTTSPLDLQSPTFPVATLPQLLTGSGILHAGQVQVNPDGTLLLTTTSPPLPTATGTTIISGTLDTSSNLGGTINLLGDKVALAGAQVHASGHNGGGNIRIGGEYKGQGTLPNANFTFISPDSHLRADALTAGNGGRVILWSEQASRIYGSIGVRGGIAGGNGGFVETSSRGFLDVTTAPDLAAPAGVGGTWLIDPNNITIVNGLTLLGISTSSPFEPLGSGSQLGVVNIQAALALGNVSISTTSLGTEAGDITWSATAGLNFSSIGVDRTLTLNADRNITLNAPITDAGSPDAGLSLILNARNNITVNNSITTQGGNVTLNANTDQLNYGSVSLNAPITTLGGDITIQGSSDLGRGISIDSPLNSGGGNITLTGSSNSNTGLYINATLASLTSSGGNITLTGNSISGTGLSVPNVSVSSTGGNITLTSDSSIDATATTLDSSAIANGGNIQLTAPGPIVATGSISSASTSAGNAGTITVGNSTTTSILVSDLNATAVNGNSGAITLTANGNVIAGQLDTRTWNTGNAGNITLTSSTGTLTTNGLFAYASDSAAGAGNGGIINLAANGNITVGAVNASAFGSMGNGGAISLVSSTGGIVADYLHAYSDQLGNAGSITLTGATDISSTGSLGIIASAINGNGGAINLTAGGNILVSSLNTASTSSGDGGNITAKAGAAFQILDSFTFGPCAISVSLCTASVVGNGGQVDITASGAITAGNLATQSNGAGVAGNLTLGNSTTLQINLGNLNATSVNGNGGHIALTASGNIIAENLASFASGDVLAGHGGNIAVNSATGNIHTGAVNASSSAVSGPATSGGDVTIAAPNGTIILTQIATNADGSSGAGRGGNINLEAQEITADSLLSASRGYSDNTGPAGDIEARATNGNLTIAGQVSSRTDATSGIAADGGNITLSAANGNLVILGNVTSLAQGDLGSSYGGTITLGNSATTTITVGNITATASHSDGGAIGLTANGNIVTANLDASSLSGGNGGAINMTSLAGNIDTRTAVLTTLAQEGRGGDVSLSALNGTITPYLINTSSSLGAGGNITFTGNVVLTQPDTAITSVGSAGGGQVTFNHFVDSETAGLQNLNLETGTGLTVFRGAGGSLTPLGNVIVKSGLTEVYANMTAQGPGGQSYTGPVTAIGDVVFKADELNFDSTVSGSGNLTLEPFTESLSITLGRIDNSATTLDLTQAELNGLQDGFSSITIGAVMGSGTITLVNDTTFKDAVTLRSPAGQINTTNYTLTGGGSNAPMTLTAGQTVTTGTLINEGGAIAITSTGQHIDTQTGLIRVSSPTGSGGTVTLNAATGILAGEIDASTTAADSSSTGGTVSFNAGSGSITLSGNLTTAATAGTGGEISFASPVILTQPITTISTTGPAGGGDVTLSQTLDGTVAGVQQLLINSGAGDITFNGAVGGNVPLGNVTLNSLGTTTFLRPVQAETLTTDAGGMTALNGNITTVSTQVYGDAVTLANHPVLAGEGITFSASVDGNSDLTIDSGNSAITFNGAVGESSPVGNLKLNTSGITGFNQTVNAVSVVTDAGGSTQLNSNITTTASQLYGDSVTIGNNPILTGNGIFF